MVLDFNINTNKENGGGASSSGITKYGRSSSWLQGLTLWSKTHPRLSFLGMLVVSGFILYLAVPWGLLFMLPDVVAVYTVYFSLAGIVAWYGSTKRLQHSYDPDVDLIYKNNSAEEPSIRRWKYKAGKFLEEYDFVGPKDADPFVEFREDGARVISVLDVDHEEKKAWGYRIGALDEDALKQYRKSIEATRKWARKQGEATSKLRYQFNQVKSQGLTAAVNTVVRDLDKLEYPETMHKEVEEMLPEELQEEETAEDILEDMMEDSEKTREQFKADLKAKQEAEKENE